MHISWIWIFLPLGFAVGVVVFAYRSRRVLATAAAACLTAILLVTGVWVYHATRPAMTWHHMLALPIQAGASDGVLWGWLTTSPGSMQLGLGGGYKEKGWRTGPPASYMTIPESGGPTVESRVSPTNYDFPNTWFWYEHEGRHYYRGFGIVYGAGPELGHVNVPTWRRWDAYVNVCMPDWAMIAILGLVPGAWGIRAYRRKRRREDGDRCERAACGYDLRGTPAREDGSRVCGECGHVNPAPSMKAGRSAVSLSKRGKRSASNHA